MERVENKMLKWSGHILPKRVLTSTPKGTKRGGTAEMEWEREAKRVMKQKNLTPEDTVNWKKKKGEKRRPASYQCDTRTLLQTENGH